MNDLWDDNAFPMAYLITIRTFGTWLHGDERTSVDRHGKNIYRMQRMPANPRLQSRMCENVANQQFLLAGKQRAVVEDAITYVCEIRNYLLSAINVRTNHAHVVIAAEAKPESIIIAFKSNATRELRAAGLVDRDKTVWSRGGSRRYLWKPHHVAKAVDYVLNGQGDDLPDF